MGNILLLIYLLIIFLFNNFFFYLDLIFVFIHRFDKLSLIALLRSLSLAVSEPFYRIYKLISHMF